MTEKLVSLVDRILTLQDELDREIVKRRGEHGFALSGRKVAFEMEAIERHRALRQGIIAYIASANPVHFLTAPVIYAMVIPLAFLDLSVTLYQHACFRIYGIARVRRSDYVVFDRHRLAYLNRIEALNCAFCGYANGVIAYAREIAGRTEQYFCPIKHALRIRDPHQRYLEFLEYGDAEGYRARLAEFRRRLAND